MQMLEQYSLVYIVWSRILSIYLILEVCYLIYNNEKSNFCQVKSHVADFQYFPQKPVV